MRWYRIRPIVRIAVFIDGGYFDEVSRYYKFRHPRGLRLSFAGLHTLIWVDRRIRRSRSNAVPSRGIPLIRSLGSFLSSNDVLRCALFGARCL
jgi:hypothetical protein